MLTLVISSFIAGMLTILAPCVLPVLPVILAGSVTEKKSWYPHLVTLSLAVSIVLFTVLLKASTLLIDIPPAFWKVLSGGILITLGLVYLFPQVWAWIAGRLGFSRSSVSLDHAQDIGSPVWRAIATWAALGPVFSTCSPTYSLLLATVFPVSLLAGIGYTMIYALGLALMLSIIAIGWRGIIARFRGIADERWWFKRILGIVFVFIGLAIISGMDKKIEIWVLDRFDLSWLEEQVLENLVPKAEMQSPILPISTALSIPLVAEVASETTLIVDPVPPTTPAIVSPIVQIAQPISPRVPTETPVAPLPQKETPKPVNIPDMSIANPYIAPGLVGLTDWINSAPLTLAGLRGKVVIVDFWTFGCINCQRTIPHLQALYEKYRERWLVIIAVHAPEFAYEQKVSNVRSKVSEYGITYPVALDNGFTTWAAYENQYWPAFYAIDKTGKVRHTHFGEGQYSETDDIIAALLAE
jgi:cytochrome c biogenesis protein CcdA/thiol-disulfide isomerase/thioredoxin